jgi:ParB family chromosome partitioning protein
MATKRLGRGLDGLLQGLARGGPVETLGSPKEGDQPATTGVKVDLVDGNPYQPRQGMDAAGLEGLKASIREHGVLQPILVRRAGARYQVVAGERRLRAAKELGLAEVPAIIRDVPDDRMLEFALIENLQREDLDPIEKAESFRSYLESTHRTQEQAAGRLGLDRSTIANMIRLLELPQEVQALVRAGLVAMGHARAMLAVEDPKRQLAIAERVAREGLSVRQVERMVTGGRPAGRAKRAKPRGAAVRDLEARLRESLGTKVTVEEGRKPGTGRIIIEFYSHDDLDRLFSLLQ